ncbi:ATP synthase subunit g, mitochondrial [Ischnura elegans]|uniref:ATP synthase subunit g, mitochondrial n=1 Tax=Ischnura elegans TaxID=197161 RepID=UPI001ED88AA8|nr:ATP synthase subunit g, mitochondrial [Ischnura elegans]
MAKAIQNLSTKGPVMIKALMDDAQPKFQTFLKYAKVELTPPTPADIPQIRSGIQRLMSGFRTGKWKQLTVRDAWLNTLVTAEVCFWFFVGECIGKRSIVAYKV